MARAQTLGTSAGVGRAVGLGIVAGLVGAVAMAMYAMIAGITYLGNGFFTPMYHIAASVISPAAMESSMRQAMAGNLYYFQAGPAVLGMAIHMMTGAAWGVLFGLMAWSLRLRGAAAVGAGLLYGLVVLVLMSFVVLPVVAALFDGGKPIADMPQMVGWTSFTMEHLMYGLFLGLVLAWRPVTARPSTAARA